MLVSLYGIIYEIMSSCVVTALIAMAFTRQTHASIQFTRLPNWHVAAELSTKFWESDPRYKKYEVQYAYIPVLM